MSSPDKNCLDKYRLVFLISSKMFSLFLKMTEKFGISSWRIWRFVPNSSAILLVQEETVSFALSILVTACSKFRRPSSFCVLVSVAWKPLRHLVVSKRPLILLLVKLLSAAISYRNSRCSVWKAESISPKFLSFIVG